MAINFSFKEWFLYEAAGKSIEHYVRNGKVRLYHYTRRTSGSDRIILEPGNKPNAYTSREMREAKTPRVFFYLDPGREVEPFFRGSPLYKTDVPVGDIYDIPSDPEKIIPRIERNFDVMMGMIMNAGYKGHYTIGRGFNCVEWYYPIEVELVEEEKELRDYFNTSYDGIRKEKEDDALAEKKKKDEENAIRLKAWEEDRARQRAWWDREQERRRLEYVPVD